EASKQSADLRSSVTATKNDLGKQTAQFRDEMAASRQQLQAANALQPEMSTIREQLTKTSDELKKQQQTLASSENFVREVFSTHRTDIFRVDKPFDMNYATEAAIPPEKRSVVLLLLSSVPVPQTLQLQYKIFAQPPNSFFTIRNLVVFSWGDPLGNLKSDQ